MSILTIRPDGTKIWLLDGKGHRDDGPALERPGRKMWARHGLLHRTDGPALMDEGMPPVWALNDRILDADAIEQWMDENGITEIPLTPEQATLFVLRWS